MIDITKLTDKDVGRSVIYRADYAGAPPEEGLIKSWNETFIFVRYGITDQAKATPPRLLRFADEVDLETQNDELSKKVTLLESQIIHSDLTLKELNRQVNFTLTNSRGIVVDNIRVTATRRGDAKEFIRRFHEFLQSWHNDFDIDVKQFPEFENET